MKRLNVALALFTVVTSIWTASRPAEAQVIEMIDSPGTWGNYFQAQMGAGFDHFNGDDDGTSLRNTYLLAHLSMIIYSNDLNLGEFENYLWQRLFKLNVEDIEVFGNNQSGADGAVITTRDSVIVVFRGTSGEGYGGGGMDQIADIRIHPVTRNYTERQVRIKAGIWDAVKPVYPGIAKSVKNKVLQGKRLWVTGHSLGGASAALFAFRIHYEDRIPVSGLQTFGGLGVGDAKFVEMTEMDGPLGISLAEVTQRFSHYEDPAPTLFNHYSYSNPKVDYEHFGITQTIFGRYNVVTTINPVQESVGFWEMAERLGGIHMEYEWAIRYEVEEAIDATNDFVLMDLMNDITPHHF